MGSDVVARLVKEWGMVQPAERWALLDSLRARRARVPRDALHGGEYRALSTAIDLLEALS